MGTAYTLPNDGEEQDRLDFMHAIMDMLIDGKLGLAPVDAPKNVLDIGTGTGIWAMEYAEQNPDSSVIGTDLALIQRHPPTKNCMFVLENSETADWSFPHTLDYVHLRFMGPCFQDVRTVIRKAFECMTPGGWIEFQDGGWVPHCDDGTLEGTHLQRWFRLIAEGGALLGFDMLKQRFYQDYLVGAGFVDVNETQILFPGNPWLKDPKMRMVGYYTGASLLQTIDSYRKFLEATGLTAEEVDEFVVDVKKDILDTSIHWYLAA
jgi:ubiquinone/menaquinone biosynthesis C-methylase UbiE